MKRFHKALVVTGLCASMALGLTACGGSLDGSQKVASVGTKTVTLGEANFLLRYQQVQSEYYYESMLGEGFYNVDLFGDGKPYGDSFKESILTQLQEYYILEDKAAEYGVSLTEEELSAISAAATAFRETNDAKTLEQMTADQATVERVLTLVTLYNKVEAEIFNSADVNVTDEEAAQRGFEYITISKGSGDTALTAEEIAQKKSDLSAVVASVRGGAALGDIATEQSLSATKATYGASNASQFDSALITALDGLKAGEVTDVIETETAIYVAQLTTEFDEEATASTKETLVSNAKAEYYNSLMETWKTEYPLSVENSVWKKVVFDRSYDLAPVETPVETTVETVE